jgi:peptidoglycan hydrolase CwlO-like protein
MDLLNFYSIIITVFTVIAGGGWFVNYKSKKRIEKSNAEINELQAKEAKFEYYLKRIDDLEKRLLEAEKTIRELKKYNKKVKKKS